MSNIDVLLTKIKKHNQAYRAGAPIISDAEYDNEVAELRRLDPQNEWFTHIEPATISNGRKAKLPEPMKSLNKVKSLNDIKQWLRSIAVPENVQLVVMPKFDGISWLHDEYANVTYSRGGAENEGQICTEHYRQGYYRQFLSWTCPTPIHFTYGELVFTRKAWEEHFVGKKSNATGEVYKSPRNTVAGFINRDEPSELIKYADFYRYGVGNNDVDGFTNFNELIAELCCVYNQQHLFYVTTANEVNDEMLAALFKEWSKIYFIDGLVLYLNDLKLWKEVGRQVTTGNPLYAIAYKHPDFTDTFETTVKSVDWKISKSGAFKPVVNIDAVDTGDCTMESPTGYNAKYVFEKGIAKGARISVTRSGGVIPKILNVITEAPTENMMSQRDDLLYCPHCNQPTTWNDTKVELVCTNPDCPGIRFAKIVHFYYILGAENMGEETLSKMYKAGYNTLKRILDITFDELMLIDTYGEATANNILAINKRIKEGVELTLLMHASDCFQGIGQIKAREILSKLPESDQYAFYSGYVATQEGFDTTPKFRALNKTMQAFLKGITPFYNFIAANKLKVLPMNTTSQAVGDKYKGMKVCFSGVRDKALEEAIVLNGGEIASGVSKNTTHLVVADTASDSSKVKKARELKIPIMTIEDFKSF